MLMRIFSLSLFECHSSSPLLLRFYLLMRLSIARMRRDKKKLERESYHRTACVLQNQRNQICVCSKQHRKIYDNVNRNTILYSHELYRMCSWIRVCRDRIGVREFAEYVPSSCHFSSFSPLLYSLLLFSTANTLLSILTYSVILLLFHTVPFILHWILAVESDIFRLFTQFTQCSII